MSIQEATPTPVSEPADYGLPADDEAARKFIVATAAPLFYARGFTAVGMDELRAATGIPLKRLYRLFPSKDAILQQVLRLWQIEWEAKLDAVVETTQDPRQRLLAVFDFLAIWFSSEGFRGCAFINSFGELGGTSAHISGAVREQKNDFLEYLARAAAGAGAPPSLAPQLALLADGATTMAAISADAEPARQARAAAEILIDVALNLR